jgi:hypothetical protein
MGFSISRLLETVKVAGAPKPGTLKKKGMLRKGRTVTVVDTCTYIFPELGS